MTVSCAACGPGAFAVHFALEARCRARWRGKSFDADAALANVGLAAADVLGLSPARFEEFQRLVRVRAFREDVEENPAERFDPLVGERWEFHVSLAEPVADGVRDALVERVRDALEGSRNFGAARVLG